MTFFCRPRWELMGLDIGIPFGLGDGGGVVLSGKGEILYVADQYHALHKVIISAIATAMRVPHSCHAFAMLLLPCNHGTHILVRTTSKCTRNFRSFRSRALPSSTIFLPSSHHTHATLSRPPIPTHTFTLAGRKAARASSTTASPT
jgi:hypothetical protein